MRSSAISIMNAVPHSLSIQRHSGVRCHTSEPLIVVSVSGPYASAHTAPQHSIARPLYLIRWESFAQSHFCARHLTLPRLVCSVDAIVIFMTVNSVWATVMVCTTVCSNQIFCWFDAVRLECVCLYIEFRFVSLINRFYILPSRGIQ